MADALCEMRDLMRDPETGMSRGYAFVSYDNFESSD